MGRVPDGTREARVEAVGWLPITHPEPARQSEAQNARVRIGGRGFRSMSLLPYGGLQATCSASINGEMNPRVCRVMELAWRLGWDDGSLQPGLSVALPGSWFMVVHQERSQNVAMRVGLQDRSGPPPSGGGPGWLEVNPNDACG